MKWSLKKIKVADMKEYEFNPQIKTEKGLKDLENSIKEFGVCEPPVLNTDLTICGGHGRKIIFERLGITEVNCYVPDKPLTEKQFQELNIRLNKNKAGFFDFDKLANFFETDSLLQWGFEEWELYGPEKEKSIKTEEIKPYNKTHILISFNPADLLKLQEFINSIKNLEGIEIEQSSN